MLLRKAEELSRLDLAAECRIYCPADIGAGSLRAFPATAQCPAMTEVSNTTSPEAAFEVAPSGCALLGRGDAIQVVCIGVGHPHAGEYADVGLFRTHVYDPVHFGGIPLSTPYEITAFVV